MASEITEPVSYKSLYHHGVDEKRRLQIPAKWRRAGEEVRLTLMLWKKTPSPCLLVLPPDVERELVAKMKSMPFSDPKAEALRRILGAQSESVVSDKAGRFCLPEKMAAEAGIEKEAVLVGMFDRFQIWSPERYAAICAADETLADSAFDLI